MNPKLTDNIAEELPDIPEQHIDFARYIAMGKKQSDAYRLAISPTAKPETVWCEASKLANNPKVRQWIDALKRDTFQEASYSREQYLKDCLEFRDEARKAGNMGAGYQYQQLIGKVAGHVVERTEDLTVKKRDESVDERLERLTGNKQNGKHLH